MDRQEILDNISREEIENIIKNHVNDPDDQVCYYSYDNTGITVGEFRRQLAKLDNAIYDSKRDTLDKFSQSEIEDMLKNHENDPDDHVCYYSSDNRGYTVGEFKKQLETIKEELYNSKRETLDKFSREDVEEMIKNHENDSDDHICYYTYNNVGITVGEFKRHLETIKEETFDSKKEEIDKLSKEDIEKMLKEHINDSDDYVCYYTYNNMGITVGELKKQYAILNNGNEFNMSESNKMTSSSSSSSSSDSSNNTSGDSSSDSTSSTPDDKEPDKTTDGPSASSNVDDGKQNEAPDEIKDMIDKLSDKELLRQYIREMNTMGSIVKMDPYPGIDELIDELDSPTLGLTDDEKEAFRGSKAVVDAINAKDINIASDYANLMNKIDQIRVTMAGILDMQPYPGIENEYEHAIEFNLDDWQKDRFQEERENLNKIHEEFPELFENVRTRDKDIKDSKSNTTPGPGPVAPVGTTGTDGGEGDNGKDDSDTNGEDEDKDKDKEEDPEGKTQGGATGENPDIPEEDEDIIQQTEEEEMSKKDKIKKGLKNAGIFIAGVGVGLAASCIPGVAVIKTGLAILSAAKLASNAAIKIQEKYLEKHPEKRNSIKKIEPKSKLGKSLLEGYRKINEGYQMIQEKLHKSPLNIFINGVSVGYLAGHIYEMVAGENVIQSIQSHFQNKQTIPAPVPSTPTPQVADAPETGHLEVKPGTEGWDALHGTSTAVPDVPDVNIPTPEEIVSKALDDGKAFDLSGLSEGYQSSYATNPVHLITKYGENNVVFNSNTVNGVDMIATGPLGDQYAGGIGQYAWLKKDDVIKHIIESGQATELIEQAKEAAISGGGPSL